MSDELDERRVQRVIALRRSAYRGRSHAIIGAILCAVAAIRLAMIAMEAGPLWLRLSSAIMLCVGAFGAVIFSQRAIALHRESRRKTFEDSTPTPDFSALSDGSQFARNLEHLSGDPPLPTGEGWGEGELGHRQDAPKI